MNRWIAISATILIAMAITVTSYIVGQNSVDEFTAKEYLATQEVRDSQVASSNPVDYSTPTYPLLEKDVEEDESNSQTEEYSAKTYTHSSISIEELIDLCRDEDCFNPEFYSYLEDTGLVRYDHWGSYDAYASLKRHGAAPDTVGSHRVAESLCDTFKSKNNQLLIISTTSRTIESNSEFELCGGEIISYSFYISKSKNVTGGNNFQGYLSPELLTDWCTDTICLPRLFQYSDKYNGYIVAATECSVNISIPAGVEFFYPRSRDSVEAGDIREGPTGGTLCYGDVVRASQ